MLDRKAIKVAETVDRQVLSGQGDFNEGCVLCEELENGVAKVYVKASPDGTEKTAGFSVLPYSLPSQAVSAEKFVVPASGSLVFSLRNANIVTASARAMVEGGSDLTVDELSFTSTPSTGTMKLDIVGGRIKFAAGDAGKVVTVIYRYNLTVAQARMKFQERSINNRDLVGHLGLVGVLKGYMEISTDQFDTTVDWTVSAPVLVGPNGILTTAGSGVAIPGLKVLAVPDLSGTLQGPFLRISALIP